MLLLKWDKFGRSLSASLLMNVTSTIFGGVLIALGLLGGPYIWLAVAFPLSVLIEGGVLILMKRGASKLDRKPDCQFRELFVFHPAFYLAEFLMKQLILPALTGLAHGISDAVAGFLVVQVLLLNSLPTVDYILLYNALAFGLLM